MNLVFISTSDSIFQRICLCLFLQASNVLLTEELESVAINAEEKHLKLIYSSAQTYI